MVAGASLGQSLHPSRCGAYVARQPTRGACREVSFTCARGRASNLGGHARSRPTTTMSPNDAEPSEAEAAAGYPARRARSRRRRRLSRRRPNVEQIDSAGLRWVNIERPGALERAWLEDHFDFHALDLEDVLSRNQRPKIDVYDDYLFIVLHFPVFDPPAGRLGTGELDLFVGPGLPGHDPEPAAAAGRVPVRALPRQGGAARAALLARLRLPALPPRRRQLRLLLPDAAQDRQQARRARGRNLRGPLARRSSATSPTSSRRSSTSAK